MEIDKYRQLLANKLESLQSNSEQLERAAETVVLDQSKVGRLSRMDAMQQQAMSQEQLRRRARQIKDIQAALQRLDEGDYGFCLDCGEDINPKRLEIDPATPYCIECADAH